MTQMQLRWNLCTVVTIRHKDCWLLQRGGLITLFTHAFFNRDTLFGTTMAGWFIQVDQVCDMAGLDRFHCTFFSCCCLD